ncbi:MAG TPA: copper resistance protein CopC [Actinomycetota bacterium]
MIPGVGRLLRLRSTLRLAVTLTAAGVAILALAGPASGHALLLFADPADGANLGEAPSTITLTFTEPLEPSLSQIVVEDEGGQEVHQGESRLDPSEPTILSVDLGQLEQGGVYTVTWQVVSTVDGHPTAGIFAFGIGVDPPERGAEEQEVAAAPTATPFEVTARTLLYIGFALLLGASLVGSVAFPQPPVVLRRLALAGAVLATLAGATVGLAQASAAGASIADAVGTAIGRSAILRAGLALLAAAAIAVPLGSPTRRLLTGAVLGAAAVLAHVSGGHAGAGEPPWPQVASQWAHVTAAGLWVGGLTSLVIGVRGAPDEVKGAAVRRYSRLAGYALAVVALSGLFRALDEVGGWSALWSTGYGRFVVAKSGLLLGLAGFGAFNRYRMVPRASRELRGFRLVSGGELVVALGALTAAAALATLVPPASIPETPRAPAPLQVSATEATGGLRVRLGVSPGTPGPNHFEAVILEGGEGVEDADVAIDFVPLAGSGKESTLDLEAVGEGRYEGEGDGLAISGPWQLTVRVGRDGGTTGVPVRVTTLCETHLVELEVGTVSIPTYILQLEDGTSSQGYLLPSGRRRTEIHFLFLDAGGKELRVPEEPEILAGPVGVEPLVLPSERLLTPGHFAATTRLTPGTWRFDSTATLEDGSRISACFEATF